MILHVFFFLALCVPIVVIGAFYAEPDDSIAFRGLPRRYAVFVGACGIVAAVMLALEHGFASV